MAGENDLTSQFQKAFQSMTTTQKAMVGAILAIAILALAGLGIWASQETLAPLASNLSPTDASAIVESLKKQNIPYEISSDQSSISVPKDRVSELRLSMAGQGLLTGDKLGFEKLETPGLTTTDLSQKVILRRAVEADLSKTLKDGLPNLVAEARVHITPSNDSPFVTEKEPAKASVLLRLRGARILSDENTQGIVNIVANSVEGLTPENVVVVDQYGRILSKTGQDAMVGASDSQKKVQREEEDHLVGQVTQLLEPVVGLGKVRATAHVDLDFDKVKINEEKFDPQSQVERSIQQSEEQTTKREGAAGVPGTPTNVAPATGGALPAGVVENSDKKQTTTNYEISKTLQSTEKAPGSVKRISLAVVVDNATIWDKDPKGEPVEKIQPRTADELKKLRDQVAAAVGIQEKRGDQLTVENIPFASTINPKEEAAEKSQARWDLVKQYLPFLVWGAIGLLVFFMIILPMLKKISAAINKPAPLRIHGAGEGGEVAAAAHARKITPTKSVAELEAEIEAELNAEGAAGAPEAQRRQLIKKRVQESSSQDPETIASLIRSWMLEDANR
jgi:flagellar M-ring protein FliF